MEGGLDSVGKFCGIPIKKEVHHALQNRSRGIIHYALTCPAEIGI